MLKILADAHIPYIDDFFSEHFHVSRFHHEEELLSLITSHDILICRSNIKITKKMLENTPIQLVASATSGTDHIDLSGLQDLKIPVLHAKGSNAHAVSDYIISTLAYLETQHLMMGKNIAIIGYGSVGCMVNQRINELGYHAFQYDPYIQTPNPIALSQLHHMDVISLHPNYHMSPPYSTHHFINSKLLETLKPKVCIINAARGNVVDENAILHRDFQGIYCTDVYSNEPNINPNIIARATLCTPHIAGHSIESKWRMTTFVARQIFQKFGFEEPMVQPPKIVPRASHGNTWSAQALSLYNPLIETLSLKKNPVPAHFKALRHQHHFRADFKFSNLLNATKNL